MVGSSLDGAQTVTTPRAPNTGSMPPYAKDLSDQQIADVTNYVRDSWGNAAPLVTPAQVAKARRGASFGVAPTCDPRQKPISAFPLCRECPKNETTSRERK